MYTRGSIALQVSFLCRNGCLTNGGRLCWNAHSNYSSISGPFCFKQTVGFCIDAGDLEQLVLTRGTAATKAATGLTMASAKGFDFYMFAAK
jgi:hypothetical protein